MTIFSYFGMFSEIAFLSTQFRSARTKRAWI